MKKYKCDCHMNEHWVCDICQGVDKMKSDELMDNAELQKQKSQELQNIKPNKSENVIVMDDKRAHIRITGINGNQHVIPKQFFEDVAKGHRNLSDLADLPDIAPQIIKEWLDCLNSGYRQ